MAVFLKRCPHGGEQVVHKFDNGLGASVIRHEYSYGGDQGLWELAVIAFRGDEWGLIYTTPITNDVIGYLSDEDVDALLVRIEALEGAE